MLEAQTNCTFLSLVSLVNYGNWCGPGSNGKDPVDDVDTCCQVLTQHPMLDFFQWTFPKEHDMCYDRIDKSGLCDGLHPALVTYTFEPAANGTLACTDCSGKEVLDEQRSNEEVLCHCKVIGRRSMLVLVQMITLIFKGMLLWCGACSLYCCQWSLCSSSPWNNQPLRNVLCAPRNVSSFVLPFTYRIFPGSLPQFKGIN